MLLQLFCGFFFLITNLWGPDGREYIFVHVYVCSMWHRASICYRIAIQHGFHVGWNMNVSDGSCHKSTGLKLNALKQKTLLMIHSCGSWMYRLSGGQLTWMWLSRTCPGLHLGSRFIPCDSHPPWTSGLATHIPLTATTGHKRGEQKHAVFLGVSEDMSTYILLV